MGLADYIKYKLPYWPNWITLILLKLNVFKGLCYGRAYLRYGKLLNEKTTEERLLNIVNYAIQHVPYYREKYGDLRIRSISQFEKEIGFIDKNEVMSNWEKFISDEIDWTKCVTGTTGGTSGKPLKLVIPKNRYVQTFYYRNKQLKQFGWNYDAIAVIRNNKLPDSRDYIINPIMRQYIFDAFRTTDEYYKKIWSVMRENNIRFIDAYPSGAYEFLLSCTRQHLDTSFIVACSLTSEPVMEFQYHLIHHKLGINIRSTYGHSEKLCFAHTLPGLFAYIIDEDYGRMELIDRKGHVIDQLNLSGEITGTTYYNKFFPLIRYRTGDYSEYLQLGEDSRVLKKIEGRWDNSQIYKINGDCTSITALNLHGDIYDRINGLQCIQEKIGYIKILIIKGTEYSLEDHKFIFNHYANAMGGEQYVEIHYVDKLILQDNGKFLPLISKIHNKGI